MRNVKRDFNDRVNEINIYFTFLENVMIKGGNIIYPDKSIDTLTPDLNKIFRANSFLLLYNLCESSIKNAVEEIYFTLNREGVSFDDLKEGIKIEIIKFLKSNINASDFVSSINNIAPEIILKCFDSENFLSGNIDAKSVREIANKYGFSHLTNPEITKSGFHLRTVKSKRNELAHGIFSFKECGKDYSIQDLISIKNEVVEYLKQILNNIEAYLAAKDYLVLSTM